MKNIKTLETILTIVTAIALILVAAMLVLHFTVGMAVNSIHIFGLFSAVGVGLSGLTFSQRATEANANASAGANGYC